MRAAPHFTPHITALIASAAMAVVFVWLAFEGRDGLAFVPIAVGLGLAVFMLVTRHTPSRDERVLWWVGAVAALTVTFWVTVGAVSEIRSMRTPDSCRLLAFDFDNDSVETLRVEWWPPRVQCGYGYSYQQTWRIGWETRWWIYWPVALVPMTALLLVGAARATRRKSLPDATGASR